MAKKVEKVVAQVIPQGEIVKIQKGNVPIVRKAEALALKSSDDETAAYDVLREIKKRTDLIEEKRTTITKPLNASLKAANALFKTLAIPLKTADSIIRGKIVSFRDKRETAAEARREKLEANGEDEKAEEVVANVGDSVTSKRWTFDVVDSNKVPREYLCLNFVVIRDAIRDGKRNIPGLKIYQTSDVRVTR